MIKKNSGVIPDEILSYALDALTKVYSGEVIFVAQDGFLMQIEIVSRRRLSEWSTKISPPSEEILKNLGEQIRKEFSQMLYGRLTVKIQKGRVIQLERTIQQRFTGLDGEGI